MAEDDGFKSIEQIMAMFKKEGTEGASHVEELTRFVETQTAGPFTAVIALLMTASHVYYTNFLAVEPQIDPGFIKLLGEEFFYEQVMRRARDK